MIPTPLKRLTAGRKEIAIAHAGSTYVLRVTKANKLILTKDADDPPAQQDNDFVNQPSRKRTPRH